MKITLHKNVTLKVAMVYMKITKDVMRSDIQEYLNGKRFNNPIINDRIDEYLKGIGVYDENKHLRSLGQKVQQTGILPTPEEGKYKIWYTESDEYFGSVIMYFQREKPHDKANVSELNLGLAENGHFLLPARENAKNVDVEYAEFDLRSTELVGTTFKTESVEVKLLLEEGKQSRLHFSGTLGKDGVIKLDSNKGVATSEKIEDVLSELIDYSPEKKRLRMRFSPNMSKDLYVNFEGSNFPYNWRGFSGLIEGIKLMPYDEEHAERWRDCLLRDELAKEYFSQEDFEQKAAEINDKAGFDSYKDSLNIPKAKDFATRSQTAEFWHIKAPIDLNPNSLFTDISENITLQKDEKLSFAQFVSRLGIGGQNDIVVYYDKYVVDERKQKAAAALMDTIDASKKIIITDMSPQKQKSDFISSNRKDLRIRDLKSGIFARAPLHNRYLIVVSPNGTKFWDIGNLLDFIRFQENDVTPDTQGKIIQPVTFALIPTLDKELLNFVNKEKNGK